MHSDDLRMDENAMAGLDPGHWAFLFISIIVTVIIVAALFGPLNTALTNLSQNQTTVGPVFQTVVPIVLILGLLIVVVGAAFASYKSRKL